MASNTEEVLLKKAQDAQRVYDYLSDLLHIDTTIPLTFIADEKTEKVLKHNYLAENPFPNVIAFVLAKLRKKAVDKLYEPEKVLQTPVIAAVLSLCAEVASEIGILRGGNLKGDRIYTDIAYSGMQAIRLYMANYTGNKEFKKSRLHSAILVDNALNGSFYKYRTKDNRYISFHVYNQSEQRKLVEELKLNKPSEKFTLPSTGKDRKYLTKVISQFDSHELEERAFACGAAACVLRSREEFEASEVGKALKEMPLIRFTDEGNHKMELNDNNLARGPLAGIKVLDLTHIIAGPACSRILAEYGADVLMVRRGDYCHQEEAMLELDGWEGKNSIQLDLNKKEDLEKMKELIKKANIITYSYQNGCFDKFGLSLKEIREINPNIIYSNLMCFSDTAWKTRPGWAPLAEDITGLSIRNGSKEHPINLNGVPLDYMPGFVLALGTLMAIRDNLRDGKVQDVTTSLCRGAMLIHEATDFCAKNTTPSTKTNIQKEGIPQAFKKSRVYVDTKAIGRVGFPAPATYHTKYSRIEVNMPFSDGNTDFKTK